jgi:hypothetical protein
MALWDSVTESLGGVSTSSLLVGAAAVVLAPVVVPAVLAGLRPLAKTVIKGGIYVYDTVGEMVSEVGEGASDLVAEARAELTASAAAAMAAQTASEASQESADETTTDA